MSLKKIISAPFLVMLRILCSVVSLTLLKLKLLTFWDLKTILGKSQGVFAKLLTGMFDVN